MLSDYLPWVIVSVVVLALVTGGLLYGRARGNPMSPLNLRRGRPGREHLRDPHAPRTPPKQAAVIVNPTKIADLPMVKERIATSCHARGWGDPLFYETTVDDPGHGQARQAVRDGAKVVCSLGGDGTVRSVASALVGTETPLGILPAGTGNLLARNLDMPVVDLDGAVAVALAGRNRRIDVGELVVGTTDEDGAGETASHYFLVMGGIGMDAAIMAGTNEKMKKTVGWPAYLLSGIRHLVSPEFRATITLDADPDFRRRARSVVIGNCGKLVGGLVLMPNAKIDDQLLDVMIASPRGFFGWVPVFTRVATRRRKGHPILDHKVCEEVRVRTDRPLPVQIDGDAIGEFTQIVGIVRPTSLTVRVSQT